MRSKLCEDGKRRILAKVEVPVDTDQISTFALVHPSFNQVPDPMNRFENLNKRQVYNLAKETIRLYGIDAPFEMVGINWSAAQIARAKVHITTLFPEVD
jgi:endonuclease YncB( thermonuclease family)